MKSSLQAGADVPAGHNSRRFFKEIGETAASLSFSQLVCAVRASPVISLNCDEGVQGSGFFVIRLHYLDPGSDVRNMFAV